MGGSKSNVLGMNVPSGSSPDDDPLAPGTGSGAPIGFDDDAIPMVSRIIATVTKDWDPTPNPDTTEIPVSGKTLADVGDALNALGEWGQGGGSLRTDAIPPGNDSNLTVNLHGGLILRLPKWSEYESASAAAKKEWNKMFAKLTAHENRHMEIAIEEGNQLATDLVGKDIGKIVKMVTAANARMQKRQNQLDKETNHGAKKGVQYGDVILDPNIT